MKSIFYTIAWNHERRHEDAVDALQETQGSDKSLENGVALETPAIYHDLKDVIGI